MMECQVVVKSDFRRTVRRLIRQSGRSQNQVARDGGFNPAQLTKLLNDHAAGVQLGTLSRIAKSLRVRTRDLIK